MIFEGVRFLHEGAGVQACVPWALNNRSGSCLVSSYVGWGFLPGEVMLCPGEVVTVRRHQESWTCGTSS